jgi:hypothetical protein
MASSRASSNFSTSAAVSGSYPAVAFERSVTAVMMLSTRLAIAF